MKVLVTGVKGQLGYDVVNELKKRNHEPIGVDIDEMDITDREAVEKTLNSIKPDAIIHCAAWTNVDGAEAPENRPLVEKVNVEGTANLAQMAKSLNAKMIYISTDYVFSGEGTAPWTPDDKSFAPLNFYGETKRLGLRRKREKLCRHHAPRRKNS